MTSTNHYDDCPSYITRDGSEIREIMHPDKHGNNNQSLAEAIIKPKHSTLLHCHNRSEELYYITQGIGTVTLDTDEINVRAGHCVSIPAKTPHKVTNTGHEDLIILCCCSPAYSHEDTELL